MSQADELLESISSESLETRGITDEHIVIGTDRYVLVPESLRKIAVQFDHNVETVTFDCPRYWDGRDLSTMRIYANYMRSDEDIGSCLCENVVVDADDDTIIHFDWIIYGHATECSGPLTFLVCAKTVGDDGDLVTHWNSELNTETYISPGMLCHDVILERHPDIITQLLERMDAVENVVVDAKGAVETIDNFMGGIEVEVETLETGEDPTVVKTDIDASIKLTFGLPKGIQGEPGKAFTYEDFTEEQLESLRGPAGEGSGDMLTTTYDPQGKSQDIFEYVDKAVTDAKNEAVVHANTMDIDCGTW